MTLRDKHLAEYNGRFEEDMRRLLKGDEGMLNSLALHSRRNPAEYGVIKLYGQYQRHDHDGHGLL